MCRPNPANFAAMEYQYHTFPNGLRVVHLQVAGKVAHCGVNIKVGSRNESPEINGMAHYLEHVLFKGTQKRKAYHILTRLDKVGGDMNAFTTKEETCIYASFLTNWYDRALELFSDILFHSSFPQKELEKEKEVIIDEINSYNDSPAELIFDEFDQSLFQGHSLGSNILGTPESVKSFTREDVLSFVGKNYQPSNMVLSSVGDIKFEKLISMVGKYMNLDSISLPSAIATPLTAYVPNNKEIHRNTFQSHCVMGNRAYSTFHPQRLAMIFLNNLLGGPSLNSRLNLNIREKYGFCYNLESQYVPYSDTGVFCVYMGTDQRYIKRTSSLVSNELKKLMQNKLSPVQLHSAKTQFIGQLALMSESKLGEMLGMGKSVSLINRVESFDEIVKKVELISSEQLLEIANEIFLPEAISTLLYSPISNEN
ncbi:MAG: pitrilysin family protein [Bacteroidota bacterium]